MGRKLEFNYERALERATRVFWAKGFSAASMRDLLKAMGIGEGSFYHLFGSKNRLYLECLKHYNGTITHGQLAALENEPSVRKGVRDFFRNLLADIETKTPYVCLMSRSLSADVLGEEDLEGYVRTEMANFQKCLADRFEKARKAGELGSEFDAESTARILFTYLQGYFRVVKVLKSREEIWTEIETLLVKLGL